MRMFMYAQNATERSHRFKPWVKVHTSVSSPLSVQSCAATPKVAEIAPLRRREGAAHVEAVFVVQRHGVECAANMLGQGGVHG